MPAEAYFSPPLFVSAAMPLMFSMPARLLPLIRYYYDDIDAIFAAMPRLFFDALR